MPSVCRFCLKVSENETFLPLSSFSEQQFQQILPGINTHIVESPVTCLKCIVALGEAFTFHIMCLETENQIEKYLEEHGRIDLFELIQQETGKSKIGLDLETLKSDNLNIKSEIDECDDDNSTFEAELCEDLTFEAHPKKGADNRYRCELCGKKYLSTKTLQAHKQWHLHKPVCSVCDKNFCDQRSLRRHEKRFHSKISINPDVDNNLLEVKIKTVNNESLLQNVLQETIKNEPLNCITCNKDDCECVKDENKDKAVCKTCNKNFMSLDTLKRHEDVVHSRKEITCKHCSKKFAQNAYLQRHINRCHISGENQLYCKICKRSFKKENDYKLHICNWHKRFICDICGRCFNRLSRLRSHKRIHEGFTDFPCPICNKGFSTKFYAQKHINAVHYDKLELIKYVCQLCESVFSSRLDLTNHKKETHPTARKNLFICDICGSSYTLKTGLRDHMFTHSGEKPHRCELCGKGFNQKGTLNVHMRSVHGERKFACSLCDRKFTLKSILTKHIEHIHMPEKIEKNYKCTLCSKPFRVQSQLNYHMQWHTNDRRFVCEICGKAFVNSTALKKHKFIHFEKKNVCEICGKSFHQKSNLKIHMKVHSK